MAISFISNTTIRPSYPNEYVYSRYENQTPLDFAITHLSRLEDIVSFYLKFNMGSYDDFYNNSKYRMGYYKNVLNSNGYVSATKEEYVEPIAGDYDYSYNEDFLI